MFWGRLVPGVRSLVSIPAGAERMPLPRFLLLTTTGSAMWNFALMGADWWLGDRFGATARVSRWINLAILVRRRARCQMADARTTTATRSQGRYLRRPG